MKIAIEARPIKWSYGTGIGNYTFALIQQLAATDHCNQYTYLWPDDNPQPYIPVQHNYTHYALPKDDQREEIEMPFWLTKERADLFHLTQNGFRTPINAPCKIVVTVHDLIPYFLPEVVRPSFLKRFIYEMPTILERADRIITVSKASKLDIIKVFGTNAAKITVIPSAPAADLLPIPKSKALSFLQEQFGLGRPFILYVGGLNARKNVAELIYAYSKVYRELPRGEELVILGAESKNREKLEQLAAALELTAVVKFPGFVDSQLLPWFYSGASLFVYPSLYEGFGLPPIEAMACDTPVITSNCSSLPEVVGDAAFQVNPSDTLQLAEAIFKVLTNGYLSQRLIKKGRQRCQLYQWPKIAAQVLEVYQNVVNGVATPKAFEQ